MFSYNYAAKLTGVVNAVRHSVAPQNVITVGEQIMQGNVIRISSQKETSEQLPRLMSKMIFQALSCLLSPIKKKINQ